jgi:uncharacterized protein YqeY
MSIEQRLREDQKTAMKAGDKATLNVVRSVRSEVATAQTAPGFSGEVDDDMYLATITTYVKRIAKAQSEYESLGDAGSDRAESIQFELDYLAQFLPQKLDESATRALVEATIADLGAGPGTPAGQVVGAVMRSGEDLDGTLVNRLVNEALEV